MSANFYPVILFAQSETGTHMKLIYSEEESAGFYSQFNIPGSRIISIPSIQNWFREKADARNELLLKILQSEGFDIVDPTIYRDNGDYTVEKMIVIHKAYQFFGNEKKAEHWLNTRNSSLKKRKPSDLYESLSGLVQVNKLLLNDFPVSTSK